MQATAVLYGALAAIRLDAEPGTPLLDLHQLAAMSVRTMLRHLQAKVQRVQAADLEAALTEELVEPVSASVFALKQVLAQQRHAALSDEDQSDLWATICDLWVRNSEASARAERMQKWWACQCRQGLHHILAAGSHSMIIAALVVICQKHAASRQQTKRAGLECYLFQRRT